MCFRPAAFERICPKCHKKCEPDETVCSECGAMIPTIGGGAPSAPGASGAPKAPGVGAPKAPGTGAPKAPGAPSAPQAPK